MGLFCLVDCRVTAGALIPGVGGILAPLKGAAPHLRHPDHRPVFLGMLALRAWHYADNHYSGALWLLYVMILVWGADSGAYTFGKMFGKHKLAPKVSPGKTWQGFFGGLLTAAVISWAYGVWAHLDVTPTVLLVCSVVAALASVLGDLTESMFKREAGIKDSGHLIPGHGGILDRIDSLTAAVPVFACLLLLVFRTI